MKVAYILASFPNTSEIFVINEIAEALRQGIDVRVFSQLKPSAACPHAAIRTMMDRVIYMPTLQEIKLSRLLMLHLRFLLKYRFSYLAAFLFALRHQDNAMLWTFKVAAVYVDYISKFNPSIIHTHFAYGSSRITMLTAKMMGIPYTFTIHGWGDLYNTPPPDLGLIILGSKLTITVCEYNRKYILDTYGLPEDKVIVIRCGISPHFFEPVDHSRRERGLLVSVGRLHYHKAFHVLIDACRILVDRGIPFRCRIAGDGELRLDLERQIESLQLGQYVELSGTMSNEKVRELMLTAEIFVMSSAVETVGLAAVEALASEVPVVATRVFGVPEMVRENETGFLCETGNPECIADRLETLLANDDLRKSMGGTGRALALQEHNLPVQSAKLVNAWAQ